MLLLIQLFVLSCFAVKGLAEPSTAAAFEAVYFYFGYLHEFSANDGDTTVGSRKCRNTECTFDAFFDNVAISKGGYSGGVTLDTTEDGESAFKMGNRLKEAGLTETIEWDYQNLVVGANKDRGYEDMLVYVTNLVRLDAEKEGSKDHLYKKTFESLRYIREAHAKDETELFREVLGGEIPSDIELEVKDLPEGGDTVESVARGVIDMVNLVKTWGYEIPFDEQRSKLQSQLKTIKDSHGKVQKQRGFKDMQIAAHMAGLSIAGQACSRYA